MNQPFGGLIRPHQSKFSFLYRAADALWVAGTLWVITWLLEQPWGVMNTAAAAAGVGIFYFLGERTHLYHSWRSASLGQEFSRIGIAWAGSCLGILVLAYLGDLFASPERFVLLSWLVATPFVLLTWRFSLRLFLRQVRRHGRNSRTVAIAGSGDLGVRLARTILASPWMGLRLTGFYDDFKPMGYQPIPQESLEVKGSIDDLIKYLHGHRIDQVFITLPMRSEVRIRDVVSRLSDTAARVYMVPDLFAFDLLNARWATMAGIPVVSVYETPYHGFSMWIKRMEDVFIGTGILLVMALPMLAIALGVKFSSPGPVIYRQCRYGLDGQEIEVWKFRTMTVCEGESSFSQARRSDPRVTRFGRFLRRTSLDELPQFINVLQGRMSIVGPRPHPVMLNEEYRRKIHGYMLRHRVKPGVTGLAQVRGWRGETDTDDKMQKRIEHDIDYIRNWSLWLDLKIIFLSLWRGFMGKNAY